jgi:hypothetical protein
LPVPHYIDLGILVSDVDCKRKKRKRIPGIKCNKKLGRLLPVKTVGVLPDAKQGVKPIASYRTSNLKRCLVGCLFHRSHICRSIALTRVGKTMACLLYAVSYKLNPEKFEKRSGTIFSEIICDYQSK